MPNGCGLTCWAANTLKSSERLVSWETAQFAFLSHPRRFGGLLGGLFGSLLLSFFALQVDACDVPSGAGDPFLRALREGVAELGDNLERFSHGS